MTQLHVPPTTESRARTTGHGWLAFAGVMFLVAAAVNTLWGISALGNDDYFSADELLFGDLSLWTVLVLVLDGLIIYGLLVHGADEAPGV